MKAKLIFNLPEDNQEFKLATKASGWWNVCWRLDQWLRGNIKHGWIHDEDEYKAYVRCREELRELINDSGLNLDQ